MQSVLIAVLNYTKPLVEVDALLEEHRKYLQNLLDQKRLLICGRLNPRTGGVIIIKNTSRLEFEKILREDPLAKVSNHTLIEFIPTMWDDCFKDIKWN